MLMSETGLTLKTAIECLEASSWDKEAALQLFQSVKVCQPSFRTEARYLISLQDTIPKEAFIQL
jgi:hypothetical protein